MRIPPLIMLATCAVAFSGAAGAAEPILSPLMEPTELAALLAGEGVEPIRLVQVSGDPAVGMIPGAIPAPYAAWLGPAENPGALPDVAALRALVQGLGVDADTPVVVVHAGSDPTDMGTATRVYWTLKSLGVENLAVLNGGVTAWRAAGLPTTTEAAAVAPSDYAPDLSNAWRVTTEDVREIVASGDGPRLVDARPTGFFEGLAWTVARPGTIAGAESFAFETWFDGDRLRDRDALRELAAESGFADAPALVFFCTTGHWASINWFVLSEIALIPDVRLYAESMAEWTQAGGALDNAPGRLTYYYRVTQKWIEETF